MTQLRFELLRCYRKGYLAIILALAFTLSLANILFLQQNSTIFQAPLDSPEQTIEHYYSDFPFLLEPADYNQFAIEQQLTPGQKLMDSIMVDHELYGQQGRSYPHDLTFFQAFQEAVALDGVELTQSQVFDLQHGLAVTQHMADQARWQPFYSKQGAADYLMRGNQILYGTLPILCLTLMLLQLYGEGERQRSVYQETLPSRLSQEKRAQWLTWLVMTGVYLLGVVVFTSLLALVRQEGLGDWGFPYRLAREGLVLQPMYYLWAKYALVFLLKTFLALGLAQVVLDLTRRQEVASLIMIGLVGMGWLVTVHWPLAHTSWNPLYFDYMDQLVGRVEWVKAADDSGFDQAVLHQLHPLKVNMVVSADFWILGCLGLDWLLANRAKRQGLGRSWSTAGGTSSKRPLIGVNFELYKLRHLIPSPLSLVMVCLVTGVLLTVMRLNDQEIIESIQPTSQRAERFKGIANSYQTQTDTMQAKINDQSTDFQTREALEGSLDSFHEVITFYQEQLTNIDSRWQHYQDQNSASYYDQFGEDLQERFNYLGLESGDREWYRYRPRPNVYQLGEFPSHYGYLVSQSRLDAFKERGIRPLAGSGVTLTPYDQTIYLQDQWQERRRHQWVDASAMGSWLRLIHQYRLDLILWVLITCLAMAGYSVDRSVSQSIHWLQTLPVTPGHRYRAKWLAMCRQALTLVGLSLLIVLGVGGFSAGWGQPQTPMPYFLKVIPDPNQVQDLADSFLWLDLWQVCLFSVILFVVGLSFLASLCLLLSLWLKSWVQVTGAGLALCGIVYGLSSGLVPLSPYLPFTYLDLSAVLEGRLVFSGLVVQSSWALAFGVLLVWAIGLYGLGYALAHRKYFS